MAQYSFVSVNHHTIKTTPITAAAVTKIRNSKKKQKAILFADTEDNLEQTTIAK